MITTQPIGDLPVTSVQMEIPRQLIRRRRDGKIGVALSLFIGQVAGGHIARNLRLSRRSVAIRKMQDIFLAKHMCGSDDFSTMFCNVRAALA
jgi:hypothetical protein